MEQKTHTLALALLCFIFSNNLKAQTISDTLEAKILNAQANGRIVDNLNNSFTRHPGGEFLLASQNKDLKFGILIYNIDIYPDRAVFSAGIAFRDPKSNQLIAFRADNISFSNTNGLSGPVKLYLISDVAIAMGQAADIIVQAGIKETYATFECKGLQEFGIIGLVNFNSDFLLPVNEKGEVLKDKKLSSKFVIKAKTWTDLVVQISMQPFQVKGFSNYVFNITNATMDLSESLNAGNMEFPVPYNAVEILGNDLNIWEGFYLQKGSVTFPEHFQSTTGKRIEFGVTNLLIDEFGFSGGIFATNLLDFEKGRIGNWNFSIDKVEIELVMNEIVRGKIAGGLGMPILPDTSKLNYIAYVGINDNYGIQVSVRDNITIPAFKVAKVVLLPNSYVDMNIKEGKLTMLAELNGEILIENKSANSGEGPKFSFPSIAFQGFRVANIAPKIDIEYLGLKNTNPSQFSKYPLCINEIYLQKSGSEKRIGIRFGLNLMEKLAVKAGISIIAEEQSEKLKFKRLDINEIEVKSSTSCFTLEGRIYFIKEDPDYGNGFSGSIKFTIDKPKIEASASILFGSVNNHRYWYFDASVVWDKPGIPFFTGAEINGFLGGAWHGMREVTEKDNIKNLQYGLTSIGKHYVPDVKAGLGLRAGVYIRSTGGSGSSTPFLAKIVLELQFNSHNGLNKISLFGNIDVMTENNKTDKADLKQSTSGVPAGNAWQSYKSSYKPMGKIGGPFMLEFDFANKIYQANFAIYLQGIANDKIVGIGHKGLAGEVSIYFSTTKWYFWIGTPQQPIGVKINLGSIGYASVSTYFMAGKDVKPAEPLPREITNILGEINADEMRKLNEMATGNAFAFGARLYLQIGSTGGESNVSIYASLKAIIGFDINVANYGKNTYCDGRSGPPGINGWFANGQLFTYLQGTVGASYKLGPLKGKLDLLTLTCAASLYCQGPNPFYSSGAAAVQVSIAGVVNKKMSLKFEIGEQCEMKKTNYTDTSLILETNPVNGEVNFSTVSQLRTSFSVPIDKPFTDFEGRQIAFKLAKYELTENGRSIPGRILWNNEKNILTFNPENLLPGDKKLKIHIVIEANELKQGRYEPILLNGKKVDEIKEIYFNTSRNPDGIPQNNIDYAYPVQNQLNYYKNLSRFGYIQLKAGQKYLTNIANSKLMALFADAGGTVIAESRVTLSGRKLQYLMPDHSLKNDCSYKIIIKRLNSNAPTEIGNNIYSTTSIVKNSLLSVNGTFNLNGPLTGSGGQTVSKPAAIELILLSYSFATSSYSSFSDKMKDYEVNKFLISNEQHIDADIVNKKEENFDYFELIGNTNLKPLVRIELQLNQTPWFNYEAKKVYSIFNSTDARITSALTLNRDTFENGFLPYKALTVSKSGIDKMMLQDVKPGQTSKKPAYPDRELSIENRSYEIITNDLNELKNALIKYVGSNEVNAIDLNKYISLLNSQSNYNKSKLINSVLSESISNMGPSSGLSITSLNINSFIQNDSISNPTTFRKGSMQTNEWVIKISKLKINPLYQNPDYPVVFYYSLPGELKPISSYIVKTASSK